MYFMTDTHMMTKLFILEKQRQMDIHKYMFKYILIMNENNFRLFNLRLKALENLLYISVLMNPMAANTL